MYAAIPCACGVTSGAVRAGRSPCSVPVSIAYDDVRRNDHTLHPATAIGSSTAEEREAVVSRLALPGFLRVCENAHHSLSFEACVERSTRLGLGRAPVTLSMTAYGCNDCYDGKQKLTVCCTKPRCPSCHAAHQRWFHAPPPVQTRIVPRRIRQGRCTSVIPRAVLP